MRSWGLSALIVGDLRVDDGHLISGRIKWNAGSRLDDAAKFRARRYCGRDGHAPARFRSDCRSPRDSQKNAATCAPKPWLVLSSGSKTQGSDQCNMSRTNTSRRRILIRGAVRFPNPDETLPHDERVLQSSAALAMRGASWKKGSRPLVSSARVKWQEIVRGGCMGFHPAAMCSASCLASVQPYPRSSASGCSACGPAK